MSILKDMSELSVEVVLLRVGEFPMATWLGMVEIICFFSAKTTLLIQDGDRKDGEMIQYCMTEKMRDIKSNHLGKKKF